MTIESKSAPNRDYALSFVDEQNFRLALELLDRLAGEGPVEYRLVGGYKTVLPRWTYNKLVPLLDELGVKYTRVKLTSMSDLPPGKQAVLRGLRRKES